jgi:curved DNA-binding protein CbpA
MKRIVEYRKLLNITPETNLGGLKATYRNLMKEWHPDKFASDENRKAEAEDKSKRIIEAYHFLVSISPETQVSNLEEYTQLTSSSFIDNHIYKGQTLTIIFQDGSVYEYFGIPKTIYSKFLNSANLVRFAKRHIYHSYTYRFVSKQAVSEAV